MSTNLASLDYKTFCSRLEYSSFNTLLLPSFSKWQLEQIMETPSSFRNANKPPSCPAHLVQPPRRFCLHQNQSLTNIMWTPLPLPQHIKTLCGRRITRLSSFIFLLFFQKTTPSKRMETAPLFQKPSLPIHVSRPSPCATPTIPKRRQKLYALPKQSYIYLMCERRRPLHYKAFHRRPSLLPHYPPLSSSFSKNTKPLFHGDGSFQKDTTHDLCVRSCPLFPLSRNWKQRATLDMRGSISKKLEKKR